MPRKAKTIIHVNQHVIRHNKKHDQTNPPITIKQGRTNTYTDHVNITINGETIATITYQPNNPLSCGARVWIEIPANSPAQTNTTPPPKQTTQK